MLFLAPPAWAHKASDSYLNLDVEGAKVQVQWDIALRDLEHAIGLDADGNAAITWNELRNRHDAVAAYALSRLALRTGGKPCPFGPTDLLVDRHTDGGYAVLRFAAACASVPQRLEVSYNLLFDLDPLHRGLLQLTNGDATRAAVFGPDTKRQSFDTHRVSPWLTLGQYIREGIWHIWMGFDHLLFLAGLLLPAVLRRERGRWVPVADGRTATWDVTKLVTSFTLAHTITLSLAATGVVELPSRLVESAIAATVIFTALNNIFPMVHRRLWMLAFAFGLIHGLGFASVLLGLGLSSGALLLSLLGFNLGVEIGQLILVALCLPLAYALRRLWIYQNLIVAPGSLVIAAVATVWLLERSLGLQLGL